MKSDTLKIVRIQVDELDPGALAVPFQDATMGPFNHWKINWLRLTADDGTVGQAMGATGVPEAAAALLTEEGRDIDGWWQRLWWLHRNNGHRSPASSGAVGAMDLALRDILAKQAGKPLHRFLGGQRDVVEVYGSGGGTNLSVDALVNEMKGLVAQGFTTVKMKVGKEFGTRMEEDVERVLAVREAIGAAANLAVDANQVWSANEALKFARKIERARIAWFEEPVHSADRHAIREISQECPFDVAMGESENHWLGFRDLMECGVQHIQVAPSALPGFARWREAVGLAHDDWKAGHGAKVMSGGGSPHLNGYYISTVEGMTQEFLHGIVGQWARVWCVCPEIAGGQLKLLSTPGLGIEVDWDGLSTKGLCKSVVDRSR
jgi:L-alanine-DL-glutamate epimerase-like enolase superfamily enzyme